MIKKLCVLAAFCCLATACADSDSSNDVSTDAVCGNGKVESGEVCDTKSTESTEPLTCDKFDDSKKWKEGGAAKCSSDCKKIEVGTCVEEAGKPDALCGNGKIDADKGEVCDTKSTEPLTCDKFDDSKKWKEGGAAKCSSDCKKIEVGTCVEDSENPDPGDGGDFVANVKPNPGPETKCNDGKHEAGEVCDPAFAYADYDGVAKECIVSDGKCVFKYREGLDNCGNGTVDDAEECDDGNRANGDGCSNKCKKEEGKCLVQNGTVGNVLLVVDGDTLKIVITDDGNKDHAESNAVTVRMHGVDSPECNKKLTPSEVKPSYSAHACDPDTYSDYSNKEKNEKGGYEASQFVKNLVFSEENKGKVLVECETRSAADPTCLVDATGGRYLAYIKVKKDGKLVDLGEELVRAGYGMAYTDFTSQRIDTYCAAEKDAVEKKAGVWSYGASFDDVVNDNFNDYKKSWLLADDHCK